MVDGGLRVEEEAYQRRQLGGDGFGSMGMRVDFAVGVMVVIVEGVIVVVCMVVNVNVAVGVEVVQQVVTHFQGAIAQHGYGVYDQYDGASLRHEAKVGKRLTIKEKRLPDGNLFLLSDDGRC